jgi:glycosyltransferase involved in cell wall biosynthesis
LAEALRESNGGRVVFDCLNEHDELSKDTLWESQSQISLIEQADLVISSSALWMGRCSAINPNTIHVKNGVDFRHFHEAKPNGNLDHFRGQPIIGYYGPISDWLDLGLVAHSARLRPQWQFVLIGTAVGGDLSSVEGLSNVHLLGEISYAMLPGYLANFDVCIIPFKLIPFTLSTNPVKVYEYMSAGKPVVSVDLPELRPYSDDCYLAGDAEEFVEQLGHALREKGIDQKVTRRLELARANSWEVIVKSILNHPVFNSCL